MQTPTPKDTTAIAAAVGSKIKLHGDRVAVITVNEEQADSTLFLPQDRIRHWFLARVAAVGDGYVNGETRPAVVKAGDIVLMQHNQLMMQQCATRVGDQDVFIIPQGDVLAVLDTPAVTYDTYHTAGNWVLCDVHVSNDAGGILLPSGSEAAVNPPSYTVAQLGVVALARNVASVGQTVIVNRKRATPLQFGVGKTKRVCVYVAAEDVLGTVED